MDKDSSGTLSFEEFVFLMTSKNILNGSTLQNAFALVQASISKIESMRSIFMKVLLKQTELFFKIEFFLIN